MTCKSVKCSVIFMGIKREEGPCMRDSKRDTDVKNSLLDSVGEGKGGMI